MTAVARLGHCGGMGLELRFTEAKTSLAPADIAAFAAVDHALLREQEADHDDTSPLGDLAVAGIIASRMRMVDDEPARAQAPVFMPRRHWPIPAISTATSTAYEAPAADSFVLADYAHGHFAWPQAPRRGSRTGAALVLAACIPMFLPGTAAAQQPATQVPQAPAPATVRPPPTTPPMPAQQLAPTATAPDEPGLQAILNGLKGHEAVVYVGENKATGLIIGVDGAFVMMVDEDREGKIVMIPKAQITDIRGKTRSHLSLADLPQKGTGALAGGGILVGVGTPLMISGLVFIGIIPSASSVWAPQVLPALLFLGGGIPLLIVGSRRRHAYDKALLQNRLSRRLMPSFGRTPGGGWTGGLSLRF